MEQKKSCFDCSTLPCWKFIICAAISFVVLGFSISMLAINRFKDTALSSFCTSMITGIVGFWFDAPKTKNTENKKENI